MTVVGNGDWRFDNLSGSHHQSKVKGCCQSNVLSPVCINWSVSFAERIRHVFGWHASYIGETGRSLTTRPTEHKRATRKGDVNNYIAEHHRLTNHTIYWDSAQCLTYSTNYFQRLTLESWFTNLEQTPSTGVNHYRHHTNDSSTTLTLQTNRTERPNFTNGSKPTNHDWPTPLESYSQ